MHLYYPSPGGQLDPDQYVVGAFVAEAAHGKQWDESYIRSDIKKFIEDMSITKQAVRNNRTFQAEYDAVEYKTPGTIEYEAHSEIEPGLRKGLPRDYQPEDAKKNQGGASGGGSER